jgi:preprotein translocase subunit YajC
MIGALKRGDRVLTAGGIIGTVVKIEEDNTLLVDIAKDVRVRVARSTISELIGKPQPAAREAAAKPEGGAAGGIKAGLMSQLFGKK